MNKTNGFRVRNFSAASVMFLFLATGSSATAESWCIRDPGREQQVCVFGTADQCMSAALIRGGICEREIFPRDPARQSCVTLRSAKGSKAHRSSRQPECDAG